MTTPGKGTPVVDEAALLSPTRLIPPSQPVPEDLFRSSPTAPRLSPSPSPSFALVREKDQVPETEVEAAAPVEDLKDQVVEAREVEEAPSPKDGVDGGAGGENPAHHILDPVLTRFDQDSAFGKTGKGRKKKVQETKPEAEPSKKSLQAEAKAKAKAKAKGKAKARQPEKGSSPKSSETSPTPKAKAKAKSKKENVSRELFPAESEPAAKKRRSKGSEKEAEPKAKGKKRAKPDDGTPPAKQSDGKPKKEKGGDPKRRKQRTPSASFGSYIWSIVVPYKSRESIALKIRTGEGVSGLSQACSKPLFTFLPGLLPDCPFTNDLDGFGRAHEEDCALAEAAAPTA